MAKDIEVFEADSEGALHDELRDFIEKNDIDVEDISFAVYTDFETEKLVYSASIAIS